MWESHVVAVVGLVALSVGWVGVQAAWRRVFHAPCADPDVLARRAGCGKACAGSCEERGSGHGPRVQEETR